ncbi:MAG: DUF1552 domain-containing protein [Gemmatimonadetes bacterium]|nr:DUF1552 domain-containing protein [Gemmatimonadota bacterium]NNL31345.1 DUF1552 domain-containing protein [Gemmatimonadota bacterium]
MEFITGKHLERRTFIKGMGASLALPFLDAMVPAGRLGTAARANIETPRLVAIEMVHGAAGCNDWGATQNLWAPAQVGRNFDLTPSSLEPLDAWREYLTIVSNTDVRMAEAFEAPEIGGDHFRSSAVFLTQQHPKQTEGSDVYVGTSLDQIHAQRFGQDTPIPSMQLCIENINQSGGCAYGYTCVYTDSISWASPTEPLPVIRDPRVAFEQLFGAGGSAEERALRRRTSASILDWVTDRVARLQRELGPNDRERLDRYLQNVRELERRIQMVEAQNTSGEERELPAAPAGVPDSFEEHVKLMFDLQALAFASDTTRVFSFKMGRDSSARVFPESGTDKPFHPASHHGGREEAILDFAKINKYHISMLPYFFEKLASIQEGDTHLLDKTMIIYGSPMGDPNLHNHRRAPLFVAGGRQAGMQGNVHLKAPDGTPMANVMLSLLHGLGHDDMDSFGDSTGDFPLSMPVTSAPAQGL